MTSIVKRLSPASRSSFLAQAVLLLAVAANLTVTTINLAVTKQESLLRQKALAEVLELRARVAQLELAEQQSGTKVK